MRLAAHVRLRLALAFAAAIIGFYGVLAYFVLPLAWTHYEHQQGLSGITMVTHTRAGIPGDPINVGLVGSKADVLCAMHAAAWYPADPITLRSSIEIVGSVLLNRPYRDAPVSSLYFQDRREDLAFEKPAGTSADRRSHVRFWMVLDRGQEGRAVWLGAATFDRGVGFSRDDGQITHHIAPISMPNATSSPGTFATPRSSKRSMRSPASAPPSMAITAKATPITPMVKSRFRVWSRVATTEPEPWRSWTIPRWSPRKI
jgi:hypothetical protein